MMEDYQRDQKRLFEDQRRTIEEQWNDMASLRAHVKNLNTQLGQVAQDANQRSTGGLSSDTFPAGKDKEQCNAMTLRSGK